MDLLPFDEYVAQLPRKRMSAGVLLRSGDGRVLLVEPSYKPHWDIPGGSVDEGESPWATAARELAEELGIKRDIFSLLVIDHVAATDRMPEGLAFIFDGGVISDEQVDALALTDPEIVSVGLHRLDEAAGKLKPALARRLAVALDVAEHGGLALCDDGVRAKS
ncbi:MAG: NUDIX domain-containing protein [Actinophytocola sp.]|nr:NUDIX domain-containing protein [Actinophytocola sp.]